MKHKKIIVLLIIITLVQIVTRIYIGYNKQYMHMDEAYSYGLMNYNKINITDNEDFTNTWHDKYYYKDYLEINSGEVFDIAPVYENSKNDVHPPFYYLLLRIFSTISIDNFTKWTGIALNIAIFAISNLFIYLICKKLFKNPIYALIVCFINGFTLIALDSCIYIRMYELCNLNILIAIYMHMKIFQKENIKFKDMFLLVISLLLGGLTHYYYFIFVLIMYIICTISAIKKKQKSKLIKYQISIFIAGILYLLIFPASISHILFGSRGITAGSDLGIFAKANGYLNLINDKFFNSLFLLLLLLIIFICHKKTKKDWKVNKQILLIAIPCVIYIITIIITSPYIESRYIMPIYSSLIILTMYITKTYLTRFWDNKSTMLLITIIFAVIIYSPKLTGTKLEFEYEKYNNIASYVEQENLPIIYVWNTDSNRFLDDIYLFTLVDKSIILDYNTLSEEEIQDVIKQNKQCILICNEGVDSSKIKEKIEGDVQYKQRMNACDIYVVNSTYNV